MGKTQSRSPHIMEGGSAMAQENEPREEHHFLYYIFKMDEKANPMDEGKVVKLRQVLQRMLSAFPKGEKT